MPASLSTSVVSLPVRPIFPVLLPLLTSSFLTLRRLQLQRSRRRFSRPSHPGQCQLRRVPLHQRKPPSPLPPPYPPVLTLPLLPTQAIAPMLRSAGFPAFFIVDQGRSGVQNIRPEWGHWCNVKGAGFGQRPTGNTGNQYIDQIVWIKPGGECDGTSNTQAVRYDSMCGVSSAREYSFPSLFVRWWTVS